MLRESKKCAWLQHAIGFCEKLGAVDNVHSDMLSVSPVKDTIVIRQLMSITMLDCDKVIHTKEMSKLVGRLNKRFGNVDPAHITLKALREIPCRTTNTATDIENMFLRLDR